jgi:antitoxin component YwqK of YwqJK toxin-antitoxin module
MKTLLSLLLLCCLFLTAQSQKKEIFFDYNWKETKDIGAARFYSLVEKKDTVWQRTDYYFRQNSLQMTGSFLDEETKINHGEFKFYHVNGNIQSVGEYVNGKRNGLWLRYHDNGFMSDSTVYRNGIIKGTSLQWNKEGYPSDSSVHNEDGSGIHISWFENGNVSFAGLYSLRREKKGKWKYYHRNGQLSANEYYEEGKLVNKEYFDESGNQMSKTTTSDREAQFPGGLNAYKKHLYKKIYFPQQHKIMGVDAVIVVVDFAIDEEGNVVDAFVSMPFHPDFDKIALNAVTSSPKWQPAVSHNRKVKFYQRQPITFAQE